MHFPSPVVCSAPPHNTQAGPRPLQGRQRAGSARGKLTWMHCECAHVAARRYGAARVKYHDRQWCVRCNVATHNTQPQHKVALWRAGNRRRRRNTRHARHRHCTACQIDFTNKTVDCTASSCRPPAFARWTAALRAWAALSGLATVSDEGHRGMKGTICGGIIRAAVRGDRRQHRAAAPLEPRPHTASMKVSECLGTLCHHSTFALTLLVFPVCSRRFHDRLRGCGLERRLCVRLARSNPQPCIQYHAVLSVGFCVLRVGSAGDNVRACTWKQVWAIAFSFCNMQPRQPCEVK